METSKEILKLLSTLKIQNYFTLVEARQKLREILIFYNYTIIEQLKFITGLSELLRISLPHTQTGILEFQLIKDNTRSRGICCSLTDSTNKGLELAVKEILLGYKTYNSQQPTLINLRNFSDELNIYYDLKFGNIIEITKWKT